MAVLVSHRVLFRKSGEAAFTDPSPVGPYVEGAVNMGEIKRGIISMDDFGAADFPLYEVHEVKLPEGLSVEEWVRNWVKFRFLWGTHPYAIELPLSVQYKLFEFGEAQKFGALKLLATKKFRSSFRESLRNQLSVWLADPSPVYESPFSPKQWSSVVSVYDAREAKRIASSIYWNPSAMGVPSRVVQIGEQPVKYPAAI